MLINVQRQPGANVIEVVDRIQELLPQLTASLPSTLQVAVLSDRTETIRASVEDVQHELIFAIGLVVLVTFLFLRNVPATIIPSIVVPLSLVGTFGVMYLAGFSINNLTLMALTIATGFVVDDAIVMVENIARHLEMGETPFQAALKGAQEIGFTLVSLTISLIAVLIPLLFMADVVGRLFREFAITLAVSILISLVVSLTLTPMMAARLLKPEHHYEQGWFYRKSGAVLDGIIAWYGRLLRVVLNHQPATLLVAVATMALTVVLYLDVPKGFFPVQDTGAIQVITEAPQSVSFAAMAERQQAAARAILQDPDVHGLSSFIGIDGGNATLNSGRMLVTLKSIEQRSLSATEVIQRLRQNVARVPGITVYFQPVQDLTIEDRVSRTQFQFILEDPNAERLGEWVPKLVERLKTVAAARRRRQRPAEQGPAGLRRHRPRCRQPPRRERLGDRRRALRRLRPAPDLDHLHPGQPVPRGARGGAALPARTGLARPDPRRRIRHGPGRDRRRPGQRRDEHADSAVEHRQDRRARNRAGDQPRRAVPGGDGVVQPRARARRSARPSRRSRRRSASCGCRPACRCASRARRKRSAPRSTAR